MPDSSLELQHAAEAQNVAEASLPPVFQEIGSTGLQRGGGTISEEYQPELRGMRGVQVFKEMGDSDPIGSAMTFSLTRLLARLDWKIAPPENATPEEVRWTNFVQSCFDDMETPWDNVLEDILSMCTYGWAFLETNYKIRGGPDEELEWRQSRYEDGLIGWRGFRIRSQDTLVQWIYDKNGNLLGMEQMDPVGAGLRPIPLKKGLLFRTTTFKDNPEGRSMLRGAYRPWFFKKRMEEFEGIGVERDLAGLPVAWMDPRYFATNASAGEKQTLALMQRMVQDVRNDASGGLVLPRAYDDKGQKLIDFELMASPGQKAFDTNSIIKRKSEEMATSILMDFLSLGHNGVGSFALGAARIDLWQMSIEALARGISSVFRDYAIKPLLFTLNRVKGIRPPELSFGDVTQVDLGVVATFVKDMVDAGLLVPDGELEAWARNLANMPPRAEQPHHVDPQQ